MNYPIEFYYWRTGSGIRYSATSGVIDAYRASQANSEMFAKFGAPEYKPRTLIFDDWGFCDYAYSDELNAKNLLKDLLADNFKVYFYNDRSELSLLTLENFSDIANNIFNRTFRTKEEILSEASTKLNQSSEQLLVLDNSLVNRLFISRTNQFHSADSFRLSQFSGFGPGLMRNFLSYLKKISPKPLIIIDSFSEDDHKAFTKLKDEGFSNFALEPRIISDYDSDFSQFKAFINECRSLPDAEAIFSYESAGATFVRDLIKDLSGIKQVSLPQSRTLTVKDFYKLSSLEVLTIGSEEQLAEFLKLPERSLLKLDNLFLEVPADLVALRKIAPNIRILRLENKFIQPLPPLCLENISNINIWQTFTLDELKELFLAAPNLETLDFFHPGNYEELVKNLFELPAGYLRNLKNLEISLSKEQFNTDALCPDLEWLRKIFSHVAPYLNALNIKHYGLEFEYRGPANLKLSINQTDTIAEKTNLPKLIATYKPRELSFESFTERYRMEVFNQQLPYLEQVHFDSLLYGEKLVKTLFTFAPNLRNRSEIENTLQKGKEWLEDHHKREKEKQKTRTSRTAKPAERKPDDECWINADTELDPNKTFNLKRIFYPADFTKEPPAPSTYRLRTFNHCQLNLKPCSIDKAFVLSNKEALEIKLYTEAKRLDEDVFNSIHELQSKSKDELFYGKQGLNLTEDWQPLASRSPEEKLLNYHLDHPIDVDIGYSLRDNMYFIRAKKGAAAVTIDFTIAIPRDAAEITSLPRDIQSKITSLRGFSPGKLALPKNPNGQDYLDAIVKQEKGACRHRSVAFKHWMQENYPNIPGKVADNDCHVFAEVCFNNRWVSCDLKGYPAKLNIADNANPRPFQPQATQTSFGETKSNPSPFQPQATQTSFGGPKPNPFKGYFKSKPPASYLSLPDYFESFLTRKKTLVVASSDEEVLDINLAFRGFCKSRGYEEYYIHSPEDLVCQKSFLKHHEDNSGTLEKGPGGKLFDFLKNPSPHKILRVNYKNFSDDDLVNLNALIDKKGSADGIALPEGLVIVGVINGSKANLKKKRDFTSRFNLCEPLPNLPKLAKKQLEQPTLPEAKAEAKDAFSIPLYHGADWKEQTLGSWKLKPQGFSFKEGPLKEGLASSKPLVFQNPPEHNDAFDYFAGCLMQDNPKSSFAKADGYDWKELQQDLTLGSDTNGLPLNPTNFSELFESYFYNEKDHSYITLPGKLETYKNQTLSLYLTRDLDSDSWGRLLERAKKHKVKPKISLAPGVSLPKEIELKAETVFTQNLNFNAKAIFADTAVIESTEADTTIKQLSLEGWIPLDISECTIANLLIRKEIDKAALAKDPPELKFFHFEELLLRELALGKKLVLYGKVSDELADALNDFILERSKASEVKGQLVIVAAKKSNPFAAFPLIHKHEVRVEEQAVLLGCEPHHLPQKLKPLSELHAEKVWPKSFEGFRPLGVPILEAFDVNTSEEIADQVNPKRQKLIDDALSKFPYVFIAGLSGIGKSTFVEEELKGYTLYPGEDKFKDWAEAKEENALLVIDEANLTTNQWSELEGLFHKPPRLRIKGELIEVSETKRVLFMGNPTSYSADRQLASLFKRHGGAVVFEPLPLAFIYERILRPMLENPRFTSIPTVELAKPILEAYRFLCQSSATEVLITARELEMMVLLTRNYCEKKAIQDPDKIMEVTKHYIYKIAKSLPPPARREDFAELFKPKTHFDQLPLPLLKGYTLTESRLEAAHTLQELIELREARQKASHKKLKFGGLGGFLLEGEPGVGKSELIFAILEANGFERASLDKNQALPKKPYYYLPSNWSPDDKDALYAKAASEQAIVVVDEINASDFRERTLNALMMGKDSSGKYLDESGFMIIGTQNPAIMSGRRQASIAFLRRLILIVLPTYNTEEMIKILVEKYPDIDSPDWYETITQVVTAFREDLIDAMKSGSDSPPSFREADDLLESLAKGVRAKKELEKAQKPEEPQLVIHAVPKSYQPKFFQADLSLINEISRHIANLQEEKVTGVQAFENLIPKLKANTEPGIAVAEVIKECGSKELFEHKPNLDLLDKLSSNCLKALVNNYDSMDELADSLLESYRLGMR